MGSSGSSVVRTTALVMLLLTLTGCRTWVDRPIETMPMTGAAAIRTVRIEMDDRQSSTFSWAWQRGDSIFAHDKAGEIGLSKVSIVRLQERRISRGRTAAYAVVLAAASIYITKKWIGPWLIGSALDDLN